MNGYSKIKEDESNKPKAINLSDIYSPPEAPKSETNTSPREPESTQKEYQIKEATDNKDSHENNQDSVGELQKGHEVGKLRDNFGVKLSRNSSVSAASTPFQDSVKRAFSMRRSSSVSERYCRIHDQCVVLPSSIDEGELGGEGGGLETLERTRSMRKKKQNKKNKFLHACKKILGL